jgi:hypothetical protein
LAHGPDLLRLAIDLAPVGGLDMPLEVTATDNYISATEGAERRIAIIARHPVSLARIAKGEDPMCDIFERGRKVSDFLLQNADSWLT